MKNAVRSVKAYHAEDRKSIEEAGKGSIGEVCHVEFV